MYMYMYRDIDVFVHMYLYDILWLLGSGCNPGFPSCPPSFIRHMTHFPSRFAVQHFEPFTGWDRPTAQSENADRDFFFPSLSDVYYVGSHACQLPISKSGLVLGDPHRIAGQYRTYCNLQDRNVKQWVIVRLMAVKQSFLCAYYYEWFVMDFYCYKQWDLIDSSAHHVLHSDIFRHTHTHTNTLLLAI